MWGVETVAQLERRGEDEPEHLARRERHRCRHPLEADPTRQPPQGPSTGDHEEAGRGGDGQRADEGIGRGPGVKRQEELRYDATNETLRALRSAVVGAPPLRRTNIIIKP